MNSWHEKVVEELRFQLAETELSLLFCEDYQDLDGYLYNAGVANGLRLLAASLTGDRTLLTFPITTSDVHPTHSS